MSAPIHPEMRVGELLEAYPGIEETLIRLAPAFGKLRNPILRKTVAKVATLQQAARVGGISVRDLVRELRQATGQGVLKEGEVWEGVARGSERVEAAPPEETLTVRETLDADALLEAGVHPLGAVREAASRLSAGEAVLLRSSFHPGPLIDVLASQGFSIDSRRDGEERHETRIGRGRAR